MSIQEQIKILALRFQFLPDEEHHRFDTIPFYTNYLRSFLSRYEGDVVWVKGREVERDAYLVFKDSIKNEVANLLRRAIHDLERIKIAPMEDPSRLFYDCIVRKRTILGCLEIGDQRIGELKKPIINIEMRSNYCSICPYIDNGKCTLEGCQGDCIIEKPFLMDGNYGMISGNLANCERIKVVVDGRL